jgi:hypothetical protein
MPTGLGLFTMTWKIYSEVALVEKRCNHCGEIIETFGPGSPLAQFMYMDLGLRADSDTSQLDFGLTPYHWHNSSLKNCLDPISPSRKRTVSERLHREAEIRTAATTTTPKPTTTIIPTAKRTAAEDDEKQLLQYEGEGEKQYAPYTDPRTRISRRPGIRGRPPKIYTVFKNQEEEEKKDEPKDSV